VSAFDAPGLVPSAAAASGSATIDASRTVNEVIAAHPATVAVFSSFGIDTCCGGGLTIADAATEHRLDVGAVLDALRRAAAAR
jgi:iron-sulfur cluster repair protein YtfE (RIC family)